MARQPEGRLVEWLLVQLRDAGGHWFKIVAPDRGGDVGIPDILGCYDGRFVSIEVKQPGESPSPRQKLVLGRIERSGGIAEVIDGRQEAREFIKRMKGGFQTDPGR